MAKVCPNTCIHQWLFLVPVKGGRWHIIPQLAVYTTYIPLIVLAEPGGLYMLPIYHLLREPETTIDQTMNLWNAKRNPQLRCHIRIEFPSIWGTSPPQKRRLISLYKWRFLGVFSVTKACWNPQNCGFQVKTSVVEAYKSKHLPATKPEIYMNWVAPSITSWPLSSPVSMAVAPIPFNTHTSLQLSLWKQ